MEKLQSEQVVIAAPMSFAGSAQRLWKITGRQKGIGLILSGALAVVLIATVWTVIVGWYLCFGLLVVPFRLLRRGSRKRKRNAYQHQEMLAAIRARA